MDIGSITAKILNKSTWSEAQARLDYLRNVRELRSSEQWRNITVTSRKMVESAFLHMWSHANRMERQKKHKLRNQRIQSFLDLWLQWVMPSLHLPLVKKNQDLSIPPRSFWDHVERGEGQGHRGLEHDKLKSEFMSSPPPSPPKTNGLCLGSWGRKGSKEQKRKFRGIP